MMTWAGTGVEGSMSLRPRDLQLQDLGCSVHLTSYLTQFKFLGQKSFQAGKSCYTCVPSLYNP